MTQPEFGVTQFVRGMAWHDAGKPFILDTGKHAPLGYWLLRLAGYPGEALVALAHGNSSKAKTLQAYFELSRQPLPAVLLLCNSLDTLSASIYSFQSRPLQTDRHTFQNSFSRLVRASPELGAAFAVQHADRDEQLYKPLRKEFVAALPASWKNVVTLDAIEQATRLSPGTVTAAPLPDSSQAIQVVERFMWGYPERTYPSVNDTSLALHCRISGVLAFTVYRNIERGLHSQWLDAQITAAAGPQPITDAPSAVREHLNASLVRVSFDGHQQWVEEAARLDDLNGARVLAQRMRTAFKRALAEKLGVPELAEFLWISESAFDLVYLLPQALGSPTDLETLIHASYIAAVDWLVSGADNPESLQRLLKDDFQRAESLTITSQPEMRALRDQLVTLGYTAHVVPVVPSAKTVDFGELAADYGKRLLEAYVSSRGRQPASQRALQSAVTILAESEATATEDVCTVCGTHPVYQPLADRLPDDVFLRKVTHEFRGEAERPCLSCIARRVLAHKQVQVDALHQMLVLDPATSQVNVQASSQPKLSPPVELVHGEGLAGPDDYLDLGAAFVRLARKPQPDRPLDIFPTISYAADSLGNVAMLTLDTTEAVSGEYDYRTALTRVDAKNSTGTERASPAWDAFIKDYAAFCSLIQQKAPDVLAEVQIVKPHLARVLARQACISTFFKAIAPGLEGAGIRVLPLDITYPTGRWLIPAMELRKALDALKRTIAKDLLAVPDVELDDLTRRLLSLMIPPLLDGTVIVFKQKFPIYLVMESERTLRTELATQYPVNAKTWYGVHLALADLRGTLTSRAQLAAVVGLNELPDLLQLTQDVDRRTITGRAADLGRGAEGDRWAQAIADARLFVRSGWWRVSDAQRREHAEALTKDETFRPVLFLKQMARE
jgi:hypothetical protein